MCWLVPSFDLHQSPLHTTRACFNVWVNLNINVYICVLPPASFRFLIPGTLTLDKIGHQNPLSPPLPWPGCTRLWKKKTGERSCGVDWFCDGHPNRCELMNWLICLRPFFQIFGWIYFFLPWLWRDTPGKKTSQNIHCVGEKGRCGKKSQRTHPSHFGRLSHMPTFLSFHTQISQIIFLIKVVGKHRILPWDRNGPNGGRSSKLWSKGVDALFPMCSDVHSRHWCPF